MSNPQKLHPISIIFTFFRLLKDLLIPLLFSMVALFRDLNFETLWIRILIMAGLLTILVLYSGVTWYRYTYRIEEDELRIEHGVFIRKKRFISRNRIQSIDLSAGPLHRIFGLTRVDVQTAGSNLDPEAGLKAVSRTEGERIRSELYTWTDKQDEKETTLKKRETEVARKISFPALLLAATTSGGIGVFLSIFTIAGSQINQLIPDDFFYGIYQWVIATSIFLLVVFGILALIVIWLMAIAGTILKYNDFTIDKYSGELRISRGLLEKKQLTVPLKKIQAIRIQENMLRQPLGYAVIYAEVAGGSADQSEDFSTVLFPMLKKTEIPFFLMEFVPDYRIEQQWQRLPRRAAKRFIYRALLFPLFPMLALVYFFTSFWWAAVIILLAASVLGYLRYKDGGTATGIENLGIQNRLFNRETVLVKRKRIQALSVSDHYFQRKTGLQTIHVAVASRAGAGKTFMVRDADSRTAGELIEWYSFQNRKEQEKASRR